MITIVTDSSAHLTREEALALGARVASMSYSLDGSPSVPEGYIGENPGCEELIAANMDSMRTSQAGYQDFLELFEELTRGAGDTVLCLPMSSRLSGTCVNAQMAAREIGGGRVQVLDSLTTSGGLYLLLREAGRLIGAGASASEAAAALMRARSGVHTSFTVDDIAPLRRSGRLGGVRLSISTILNIRPVLRCAEGAIVADGCVRGREEQLRTLLKSLPQKPCLCAVEGFLAGEQTDRLERLVREAGHSVSRRRIGPVLGIHLGVGCMGLSWMESAEN